MHQNMHLTIDLTQFQFIVLNGTKQEINRENIVREVYDGIKLYRICEFICLRSITPVKMSVMAPSTPHTILSSSCDDRSSLTENISNDQINMNGLYMLGRPKLQQNYLIKTKSIH